MITYRITDVIGTDPLYKKIKMLVYLFHLDSQESVLYVNGLDVNTSGIVYNGVYGTDFGTIKMPDAKYAPDLGGVYLINMYNALNSKYINWYVGKIDYDFPNSTYDKWYYLITLVDPNAGIALVNLTKKSLSPSIELTLDETLLSSSQPILRYSRLYALGVDGKCSPVVQTGFNQEITAI